MAEETFNLYGIKITCFGDVKRARLLAPHARRLMPQIKNLGLPTHMITSPDGSYVQVLHQAGMDFARIYVPPGLYEEQPKKKVVEEFSQLYYPAWFAYNEEGDHIGYIVAKGDGWQGPYEFIPREADNMRDDLTEYLNGKIPSFEMGQWAEYWGSGYWNGDDSRPFEWDDYLTPKYISSIQYPGIAKYYYDIAPIGAKNRFFVSDEYEPYSTADGTISHSYIDKDAGDCWSYIRLQMSCIQTGGSYQSKILTISDDETISASQDNICDQWPSGHYKPLNYNLSIGNFGTDLSQSGSLEHSIALSAMRDCEMSHEERVTDLISVLEEDDPCIDTDDAPLPWGEFTVACPATVDYILDSNVKTAYFRSAYSSAEDNEHYGLCYTDSTTQGYQNSQQTIEDFFNPTINAYCYSATCNHVWDGEYHTADTPTYTITPNENLEIDLSGSHYSIALENGIIDHDKSTRLYPYPRYYHIGDIELFLISLTRTLDDGTKIMQYVFIRKSGESDYIDYSIYLNDVAVNGKLPFPGMVDDSGNGLYVGTSFRLIRVDEKTIKEQ